MDASSLGRAITVVGAGFMGTVIATVYARYGYEVRLADSSLTSLDSYRERATPIAKSLIEDEKDLDAIFNRVLPTTSLEDAVKSCFLVHEAIHEDLTAKQLLFRQLDGVCAGDVVLATNTSSFSLSDVFLHVRDRSRVLGIHYITPAHIIKLVELVVADFTPPELVKWAQNLLATIDHVGVVSTDSPGFLVNRLQYAVLSEAYRIVEEGVATRDDVDRAMRLSLGPRLALWGPLLTEDLVVSKKTAASVWNYLHDRTGRDIFRRPSILDQFTKEGLLGAIVGKGWYRFSSSYPHIVSSRDRQLGSLLKWLSKNDQSDEFKAS